MFRGEGDNYERGCKEFYFSALLEREGCLWIALSYIYPIFIVYLSYIYLIFIVCYSMGEVELIIR